MDRGAASILKPWIGGLGIQRHAEPAIAIDACDLSERELKSRFPNIYQYLTDTVLPERRENSRKSVREKWWVYGEARNTFRPALRDIDRIIVTSLTASQRVFTFFDVDTVADSTTVIFAIEDAGHFAIISSRFHMVWALSAGGTLEDRPRYNKSLCFDPFPFPTPTEPLRARLRQLGEDLDAHRKTQQAQHPKLTLTAMYNCLEKLRAGDRIEGKDKETYDQGLIGILRDLHDQIDAATAEAYGWPATLSDDEILHNLVALNRTRAAEEAQGQIRWLRPEYQNPAGQTATAQGEQTAMDIGPAVSTDKTPWPKTMPEQIAAVRAALAAMGEATPDQIARHFARARTTAVQPLLESLAALGYATRTEGGRFLS